MQRSAKVDDAFYPAYRANRILTGLGGPRRCLGSDSHDRSEESRADRQADRDRYREKGFR